MSFEICKVSLSLGLSLKSLPCPVILILQTDDLLQVIFESNLDGEKEEPSQLFSIGFCLNVRSETS